MLAAGAPENLASSVVNSEANKWGGYNRSGEERIMAEGGSKSIIEIDQRTIVEARKKLDEMGIKRIDRRQYADKKKQVYS